MCNKFYWLAVAGVLLGATLESDAALLLSNNPTNGDYPGAVPTLATGATYSWAGNDTSIAGQDPDCTKVRDGLSEEAAGGYTAVYGAYGTAATSYTAVFDLKGVYQIEQVGVSTVFSTGFPLTNHNVGIGTLTVWTSADGINYGTAWGQLVDPTPINSHNALLSVTGLAPVDARYVRVEIDRYGSGRGVGDLWGFMQAVTGEIAIFGAVPVPEPATLGLLALGGLILLRRRR